ncbi:MAG: methionyl-tRNA formyltransferase [SAR86 cluster bacterium]|uniref:methionyl-tRNA formyltransferase n=1 Tax=SAR86 cluster bacterium TaxID=2030880 RepID=A0A368BLW3_9GAMM|nr:MAG: methionyl-tRNA formyltransferase [SAR86 cluster bacterium]
MKILYAGSSQSSAEILKALINDNHEIVGVISQPDKRSRRSKGLEPSHVSAVAETASIKVYKPFKLDEVFKEKILSLDFDLLLVVAYGKILPKWLLESSTKISINIHFSLLPKYRGASPIQSALLNNDDMTGISVMKMTEGLDEGPVFIFHKLKILDSDNRKSLEQKLTSLCIENIEDDLSNIFEGKLAPVDQNEDNASYCKKIDKLSGKISFKDEKTDAILRKYKAYFGWPGLYFEKNNLMIKIHGITVDCENNEILKDSDYIFNNTGLKVKTMDSYIVITHLQFPGKAIITSTDAANSYAEFFEE